MLTLHHLNNSRSQRILWLLEELGADYEIRRYERDPTTRLAPPDLYEVHPLGKSPVIEDGGVTTGGGITLGIDTVFHALARSHGQDVAGVQTVG